METKARKNVLTTKQLTEIAMFISFAVVLEVLASVFPRMPQGGSLSISFLPLLVLVYRHGFRIGVLAGVIFGLFNWMLTGFQVHVVWFEGITDYLIASGVVGFAALIFTIDRNDVKYFVLGAIFAGLLRFLVHFLSGIFIFDVFLPEGQNLYLYSLIYNAWYMIPTIILLAILSGLSFHKLKDAFQQE